MDKKKALERLTAIEAETKELRDIINAPLVKNHMVTTITEAVDYLGDCDEEVIKLKALISAKIDGKPLAFQQLIVVVKTLNEKVLPNWNNTNEAKYYPWWDMRGGLRFFSSDYYYSCSNVPSHLCFRSEALCAHAAKYFYDTYKAYMC